jgi:hypothetical protein
MTLGRLRSLHDARKGQRIRDLIAADADRGSAFSVAADGLLLDYSKTLIDAEVRAELLKLAGAAGLGAAAGASLLQAEAGAAVVAEGAMATAEQEKTPRFFRGNMSTTVLVNGVNQIRSYLNAPSWSAGIVRAVRDSGAYVQDVWMVKRQGTEVVSCLVQFSSRFQKLLALAALTDLRMDMQRTMGRVSSNRVNARDAFPREQLDAVKACYNRGYELKKAGLIESYRIYNTGEMSPTFEVRTKKDGKVVWGPPPPRSGETPPPHLTQRQRLRPARSGQRGGGEGMEIGDADSGTESYSPQNGTGRRGNGGAPPRSPTSKSRINRIPWLAPNKPIPPVETQHATSLPGGNIISPAELDQ